MSHPVCLKNQAALILLLAGLLLMHPQAKGQQQRMDGQGNTAVTVVPVVFDGVLVAGYADQGAFINFAGPAVRLTGKPLSLSLGMLPSLRIKKDQSAKDLPKNSAITPSLGAGLTFCYGRLALQVPIYYNAKTAVSDGKWVVGGGIGYHF